MKADAEARIHRLTLDRDIQQAMETLAREQAARLGSRLSTAVLVVDHASGEVLAHVGSADYFDHTRFGGVDMIRAVRSPGSALKPFIYGLAFENGAAHPETLIEDRPVRFGHYAPKNFDEGFHGTVNIREALQQSLNIPAVKVLAQVTPQALVGRFRQVGVPMTLPDAGEPSLAIALGGVGFRLSDLTALYAGLARGGEAVRLIHRQEERTALKGVEPAQTPAVTGRRLVRGRYPRGRAAAGECARIRARSPTRPARRTAIAMPGRSASMAARRSRCGSGAPIPRRRRD